MRLERRKPSRARKAVSGETKTGHKVGEVRSFSESEIKDSKIAFDYGKMVDDASAILKERKAQKS